METVCRLCASKPESYVDAYDNEGKSMNLVKKIAQCLQIWVSYKLMLKRVSLKKRQTSYLALSQVLRSGF